MNDNPKVAVIGPFHNNARHVWDWIEQLRGQTHTGFDVYAIDDGSTDGTPALLQWAGRRLGKRFHLLALDKNCGPAAARNRAILAALAGGAKIILLLDSDCRVPVEWVAQHAEFHHRRPDVSILGGAIRGRARTAIGKADGYASWFTAIPNSKNGEVKRLHLSSTNLSLKRSVFEQVGFFDEQLATGEDVALCRKAQKAGLILWFESNIEIEHIDRETAAEARRHHYRWGLHSYTLSRQEQGGYYGLLTYLPWKWPVALLVPVLTILHTAFIVARYGQYDWRVLRVLPKLFYLKWWNALGVFHGFRDPTLCLLTSSEES